MERWLAIARCPGFWISDLGSLRSYFGRKWTQRGTVRVELEEPRLITPDVSPRGYLCTRMTCVDGTYRTFQIHRLVLEAFVGSCPPGHEGCHKDGDRKNPRLDNLYWGTRRENVADTKRHGRLPQHKFTDEKIREVLALKAKGLKQREIAEIVGTGQASISRCLLRNGVRTRRTSSRWA